MVLLRLGTNVVAWTGRVIQCTVTRCTLLWLMAVGIQPTTLEVVCCSSLAEGLHD